MTNQPSKEAMAAILVLEHENERTDMGLKKHREHLATIIDQEFAAVRDRIVLLEEMLHRIYRMTIWDDQGDAVIQLGSANHALECTLTMLGIDL